MQLVPIYTQMPTDDRTVAQHPVISASSCAAGASFRAGALIEWLHRLNPKIQKIQMRQQQTARAQGELVKKGIGSLSSLALLAILVLAGLVAPSAFAVPAAANLIQTTSVSLSQCNGSLLSQTNLNGNLCWSGTSSSNTPHSVRRRCKKASRPIRNP